MDDTNVDAHYFMGLNYQKEGKSKSKKAIKHLSTAVKLNPKNKEAHYKLGQSYIDLEDQDAAMDHLNTALALDENFILALISRGMVHQELGDKRKSFDDLQRA